MTINAGTRITASLLNGLPSQLDQLATGSATNSTAENTIGTFPNGIPVNDAAIGSAYRMSVYGTADNAGTPTLRLHIYLTTVTSACRIFDSGPQTLSGAFTAAPWAVNCDLTVISAGSSGTFACVGIVVMADVGGTAITSTFAAETINTTVANAILVTAIWGTASSSNTCRTTGGSLYRGS